MNIARPVQGYKGLVETCRQRPMNWHFLVWRSTGWRACRLAIVANCSTILTLPKNQNACGPLPLRRHSERSGCR